MAASTLVLGPSSFHRDVHDQQSVKYSCNYPAPYRKLAGRSPTAALPDSAIPPAAGERMLPPLGSPYTPSIQHGAWRWADTLQSWLMANPSTPNTGTQVRAVVPKLCKAQRQVNQDITA